MRRFDDGIPDRVLEALFHLSDRFESKESPAELLARARRLRQRDEAWEGSARVGRFWIFPPDAPPYRPYVVRFVTAKGERHLRSNVVAQPPTVEEVFAELLRAMCHPRWLSGGTRRPAVVYLDNEDLVSVLRPWLAELGVRCEYRAALPAVQRATYDMEKAMTGREPVPGLLTVEGVTPPLVGHLYELAAEFYRRHPWYLLNDRHPIEIRYPPEGKPRFAIVMGSGGEVFGLAVYDSLEALRALYTRPPEEEVTKPLASFFFYFDEATAMAFEDLEAMEKYGWLVAAPDAYPIFGRPAPDNRTITPTRADLYWAEGALATILLYVRRYKRVRRGVLQPAEITVPVMTISGQAQVYLRLPAIIPPGRR